jgi:hypothetical protein
MNHINDWKTIARTEDHDRSEKWREIFGINVIPIKSVVGQFVNLPGRPGSLCYMLDVQALSPEQLEKLVTSLAEEHKIDIQAVRNFVMTDGVPILTDSVSVESTDQEEILNLVSMIGEFDTSDPFICGECGNPKDFCSCNDDDWKLPDE